MAHRAAGRGLTLALGGGGARGLAHIGVLEVLDEEGIPVSAIAGTSMGGLVGSIYAAGIPLRTIQDEIGRLLKARGFLKLVDVEVTRSGISIKGKRIYERLADHLGEDLRFDDLGIPLALVTADLCSGRRVVLTGGNVAEGVRSTISIPGVFAEVKRGGMRLVDGGILDNVPAEAARALAGGPVVAVDVLPGFRANEPGEECTVLPLKMRSFPGLMNETLHMIMVMISEMTAVRLEVSPPDLVIRPEIPPDVTILTGFGEAAKVIEAGRKAAAEALPALRALLEEAG